MLFNLIVSYSSFDAPWLCLEWLSIRMGDSSSLLKGDLRFCGSKIDDICLLLLIFVSLVILNSSELIYGSLKSNVSAFANSMSWFLEAASMDKATRLLYLSFLFFYSGEFRSVWMYPLNALGVFLSKSNMLRLIWLSISIMGNFFLLFYLIVGEDGY